MREVPSQSPAYSIDGRASSILRTMSRPRERVVADAVRRAAQQADAPLLLAVSGGMDSMVLLRAMMLVAPDRIAGVATFDHGTGEAARRAADAVQDEAARLGVGFFRERLTETAPATDGLEAHWRRARHAFLRRTALPLGARVATAHTRDDQVETVLMRIMRGSGARGLAGLAAPSAIVRPLLTVSRSRVAAFAQQDGVSWTEDPSNASAAFLRNRVRHDLLPALRRVDPTIDDALIDAGAAAASWRAELDELVREHLAPDRAAPGRVVVATSELADYDRSSLCILWGALAGMAGLPLDRRGTHRCAAFTMKRPRSGAIPLSGGWELEARGGELMLRRAEPAQASPAALPAEGTLEWGRFRFRSVSAAVTAVGGWGATLPAGVDVQVRCWQAGDRFAERGRPGRRVKRYLSDVGVRGSERESWPVVTVGDEVVWIPGVRRSDAATAPSGDSALHYLCERTGG